MCFSDLIKLYYSCSQVTKSVLSRDDSLHHPIEETLMTQLTEALLISIRNVRMAFY